MGTYTTNKNLFMPTVGEQGWGTLVNGNFETIDTFLKPISLSGSTYTFTGNHVGNQSGGTISATSITNSGTSTFTGKITANGGIGTTTLTTSSTITSTGKITGNGGIGTTSLTTSGNITSNGTISAAKIKQTGATTVAAGTPTTVLGAVGTDNTLLFVLPDYMGTYTGSIKIFNNYTGTGFDDALRYHTSWNTGATAFNTPKGTVSTLSFTNVKHLYVYIPKSGMRYFGIGAVTLS